MTFGLVISHDGGATWQWMCEAAVGYGGLYDPFYSYTESSKIFATTFAGLKVMSDGCTFAATPPGMTFISDDDLSPDHSIYLAAADTSDSKIYKSTDDGVSFPTSASPGKPSDWWQSLVVAPGNVNDVFIAGYRYVNRCAVHSARPLQECAVATQAQDCNEGRIDPGPRLPEDSCINVKELLVFKSIDGGTSFQPLPGNQGIDGVTTMQAGIQTSKNSTMDLVGVSSDGSTLYARISFETANLLSDGLYKLDTTSGTSWTRILGLADSMSVVVRSNGDLVVMTKSLGGQVSSNGGTTWTPLANPPHVNCLVENPVDHTLWACTQNYGSPNAPADNFGIMKTTDLATWTGVLAFQAIQKPVSCAAGTPEHDMCEAQTWCSLKQQLGITSTAIDCPLLVDAPAADSGSVTVKKPPSGCCDTGGGAAPTALVSALGITLISRRRRRPGASARA
jgi:hypothetical protein